MVVGIAGYFSKDQYAQTTVLNEGCKTFEMERPEEPLYVYTEYYHVLRNFMYRYMIVLRSIVLESFLKNDKRGLHCFIGLC